MPHKTAKNTEPDKRAKGIHQRLTEVEWCIERMLEAKADGQGWKHKEMRIALRAEFPDSVDNMVKASLRIKAAKKAVDALLDERKDSLRAVVYNRLEELFARALDEEDRREAREVLKDLVKDFGLAAPEKTEIDLGEVTRQAILGKHVVEITQDEIDSACDVSD